MDRYNIAEYITIVKKGLVSSSGQGPAGMLLLGEIGSLLSPRIDFDDTKISRLCKHINEVPVEIVRAISDSSIVLNVISGFQTYVARDFNPITIDNACHRLITLINNEPNLHTDNKNLLNHSYLNDDRATFLANALIHVVGMTNTNDSIDTTYEEIPYLSEANNHCPLCGNDLVRNIRGRRNAFYGITKVYDEEFDDETKKELESVHPAPSSIDTKDNRIALCLSCYSDYRANPTHDTYQRLISKKQSFERNSEIDAALSRIDVEKSIEKIINDLGNLSSDKAAGLLPLDPKEIKDKITDDVILRDDVTHWVLKYYKFIEQQFSNLDSSGKTRFKVIANQVSTAFESLDALELMNQQEIFNRLSLWMADDLGYSLDMISVVNIMIAFFVQNCEVFHEISE
ncbi:MAG: hypothetical protein CVV57_09745 [Tenericutes bacterium HGW-Tenericutes-2]|jgi:hypothetical protein|nr:MAG: hypothetical protein CVV58_01265 [Tenericutes bacterium HGW-Tenericutes-3]PKK97926.1 MAG: hypothetical protein CVV57_09745 [Tenericutes bacterium HGW-Tenericutes-2]